MKFRILAGFLAVLALLPGAAAAEPVVVRFANLGAATDNLYQYLGIEKGIYAKHNVDLKLVSFLKGGPEVIAAAASEQVDLGGIGTPILTGISRGIPIKVVGAPPSKRQEFVLVALPEIKRLEDLKGRTVGVSSVGGGQAQALKFILKARNINQSEIKTIAFGNGPNGYIALRSGQLAAVMINEPMISRLELEGIGRPLERAVDYYGRYQHSYIFASNAFIQKHPDAIRKFFEANREAISYARDHQDELIAFGEKKLELSGALLKKIFDAAIPQWDDSQSVDVEGLLNAVKIVQDMGDINKSYKPDIAQIADLRFATQAGE